MFAVISNNQSQPDSADCRKCHVAMCILSVSYQLSPWVCVGVGLYSENGAMPSDDSKQHMTVCGLSLHLDS